MKLLLAFLIVAVLLTSGCTIPGSDIEIPFLSGLFGPSIEEFPNDVIAITALTASPYSDMRSGQSLTLKAVIKNTQAPENNPQKDIKVILYNTCDIFEVDRDESNCNAAGEANLGSWSPTTGYICEIRQMYPKSTAVMNWRLRARDVKVKTPCEVGVMVEYGYETPTTSSVTFVNQEELENLIEQGRDLSELGSMVVGEGPVKSYISVADQPILLGGEGTGLMSFWVENKGTGTVVDNKITVTQLESMKGNDQRELVLGINTPIQGKGADTTCQYKVKSGVSLIGKKSPIYSCEITVGQQYLVKQEKTYQINSLISYRYKFTKDIRLTVEPQLAVN